MRIAIVVTNVRSSTRPGPRPSGPRRAGCRAHLRIIEAHDFEITSTGRMVARAWCIDRPIASGRDRSHHLQRAMERRYVELTACDMILLRVNPLPWHILQLATMASAEGVPVINHPAGICATRGKAWLASLTDVPTPPTLVTSTRGSLQQFAEQYPGKLVIKPATGSGGRSVQLVDPRRPGALQRGFEIARAAGGPVVVQAYLRKARRRKASCLGWRRLLGGYLRTRTRRLSPQPQAGGRHTLPRLRSRTKLWLASSAHTS